MVADGMQHQVDVENLVLPRTARLAVVSEFVAFDNDGVDMVVTEDRDGTSEESEVDSPRFSCSGRSAHCRSFETMRSSWGLRDNSARSLSLNANSVGSMMRSALASSPNSRSSTGVNFIWAGPRRHSR